jgi:hypothetical protein
VRCASSKPGPHGFIRDFEARAVGCGRGDANRSRGPVGLGEPRSRTELVFEIIALRHQIAVLKRSGTRRPRFGLWDRHFWILLSWWWPRWSESLMIIQPDTVKRWRRNGWTALQRYRSGGHWRGGRPKVSREVRELITRMARENFLWGAPRIHGELLMLGLKVSQATVSRYLTTMHRSPGQSWRTFIRNEALAFKYRDDLEYSNDDWLSQLDRKYRRNLRRSAGQITRLDSGSRWLSQPPGLASPARLRTRSTSLRGFRSSTAPALSSTAGANLVSVSVRMRGPPRHTSTVSKSRRLALNSRTKF